MSPSKRRTSAFSSAGDRSSRFPGGDMPRQNLKSLYAKAPTLQSSPEPFLHVPLQLPPAKPPLPELLPLLRADRRQVTVIAWVQEIPAGESGNVALRNWEGRSGRREGPLRSGACWGNPPICRL